MSARGDTAPASGASRLEQDVVNLQAQQDAHEEICAIRYSGINEKLGRLEKVALIAIIVIVGADGGSEIIARLMSSGVAG